MTRPVINQEQRFNENGTQLIPPGPPWVNVLLKRSNNMRLLLKTDRLKWRSLTMPIITEKPSFGYWNNFWALKWVSRSHQPRNWSYWDDKDVYSKSKFSCSPRRAGNSRIWKELNSWNVNAKRVWANSNAMALTCRICLPKDWDTSFLH